MTSALLYLQLCSFKNRLISRLRRLKQPKYLAGFVVGGAYMYFFFFRHWFTGDGAKAVRAVTPPDVLPVFEMLGALVVLVIVFLAWLLPKERSALQFTEAEVAFLFAAPVSRRTLIHFKLLKSQAAIIFSSLFFTLFAGRLKSWDAWIYATGMWLLFSTLNLHFLGASFVRTMLLDRGITTARRRLSVVALLTLLVAAVVIGAGQTLRAPTMDDLGGLKRIANYVRDILGTGLPAVILLPFRLLVRPAFAASARDFLLALGPALALLIAHYWWVVRSNVAFEEASVEAARKLADRMAAARAGNLQLGKKAKSKVRQPFTLGAAGSPMIALFWKNLILTSHWFTWRIWLVLIWLAVVGSFFLAATVRDSGVRVAVGGFALGIAGMALLMGPHVLHADLRHDLPVADVLKMYPLRGWQVVLGEILAPAAVLACVQWLLLIIAVGSFPGQMGPRELPLLHRAGFGLGIGLVAPLLNVLSLLIINAGVLYFPAWSHLGPGSAQGFEVMGQRMILMVGQLLVLALGLLPAALVFALLFFLGKLLVGPIVAMLVGAVGVAAVLAVEGGLAIHFLGRLFERFDVSAELNA
ncbi:MAG: hypothetical protein HYY24_00470 [Verrucomicrobia bacterium]|nr:hypothetical protein [Verrucomicrobiota bacterium]